MRWGLYGGKTERLENNQAIIAPRHTNNNGLLCVVWQQIRVEEGDQGGTRHAKKGGPSRFDVRLPKTSGIYIQVL